MDRHLNLTKYHKTDRVVGRYKNRKNIRVGANFRSKVRSELSQLCNRFEHHIAIESACLYGSDWEDISYVVPYQERHTDNWWDCNAYKHKVSGGGIIRSLI